MSERYTDLTPEAKRAYHRDHTRQWRARDKEHAAELSKKHEATWRAKHPSVKAQLAAANAEIARWKEVARNAGVCMSCALGAPETYGCTDCLNTGWNGGAPAGFADIKLLAAAKAEVALIHSKCAEFMSGLEVPADQLAAAQARIAEAEKVIDALIFEMRAGTLILQGGAIDAARAWKDGKP